MVVDVSEMQRLVCNIEGAWEYMVLVGHAVGRSYVGVVAVSV
jgi:hypothetical protein